MRGVSANNSIAALQAAMPPIHNGLKSSRSSCSWARMVMAIISRISIPATLCRAYVRLLVIRATWKRVEKQPPILLDSGQNAQSTKLDFELLPLALDLLVVAAAVHFDLVIDAFVL